MPNGEKPTFESYSVAIIKPDAYRDFLEQVILDDFEKAGLSVVFRKEMKLNEQAAKQVYLEHETAKLYPFMVQSLLLEDKDHEQLPCMLVILRGQVEGQNSVLTQSQRIKGRADKEGIRAKYRMYYWHELEKMGYTGNELDTKLAQNRLHIPDDYQRTAEILGVLMTESDINRLAETAPDFADWLGNRLEEIKKH